MDCEKFESTLLDELYEELDEVTSAAAKRHVGGCARCASLLSGLKATRRIAVLPVIDPPADLEDRILAAAREAQKVVPISRRAGRMISWAGSWAMRPQTGMAAVFLLMTGISALLLKGKHSAPPSSMTVSEQGEPVASVMTGTLERPPGDTLDTKAAAPPVAFAPTAPAAPAASAASAGDNRPSDNGILDGLLGRARTASPPGRLNMPQKPSSSDAPQALGGYADKDDARNASNVAGAPAPHMAYAPGAGGGAAASPPPPPAPAAAAEAFKSLGPTGQQAQPTSSFDSAKASYDNGDYATATTLFNGIAANGDLTAALWAARSTREGSGCAQAIPKFDQVARTGAATKAGHDATLEGGQCYRQLGMVDTAATKFRSLLTVPGYIDKATAELQQMKNQAQVAQKSAAKPAAKAGQQQQAPAAPSQANPAATSDKAQDKAY